jgi:hypothetical protein
VEALASFRTQPEPLTDEELKELEERDLALLELSRHPGWPVLVRCMNEEVELHRRTVLRGALTPEQYIRETGWIAGAEFFADIPARINEMHAEERAMADGERAEADEDDRIPA